MGGKKVNLTTDYKKNGDIELTESELISRKKDEINQIIPNKIKLKGKTESQNKLIRLIKDKEILITSGRPGSGKSFVALAKSIDLLTNRNNKFTKIYLVKSITPLKGEELGAFPGEMLEKINPYMLSYFQNLEKLIPKDRIESLIVKGYIEMIPIAILRGTGFDNSIIIVDETQNISIENFHTILTRIGHDSKMICLGDTNQIDLKKKSDSALSIAMDIFCDIEQIGTFKMSDEDANIRNPLIDIIENVFENYNKKQSNNYR
ncbi:MAG: PhoH family protein [bacterium]